MNLFVEGLASHYEIENVCRLFFPATLYHSGRRPKGEPACFVRATAHHLLAGWQGERGDRFVHSAVCIKRPASHSLAWDSAAALYKVLKAVTGQRPPWGMLTGVRPVAFLRSYMQQGLSEQALRRQYQKHFDVSDEKYALARQVAAIQQPVLQRAKPGDYSLYISIPFCPSRCSYCSFVSRTTKREGHLIPTYVQALVRELRHTGALAKQLGLSLKTVYVGGGTPTAISAGELKEVLQAVNGYFPMHETEEFTVEAGRPDTIDAEKLSVIKAAGVTRLCVNPQTLENHVLQAVGRPHTGEDFEAAFKLARSLGFDNINTDLICALPGDTKEGFARTLRRILALRPENVTVHTLTLKRASDNVLDLAGQKAAESAAAMLQEAAVLPAAGYLPYYLYRQKGTVENLENTGYTLPGYAGLYNIYMMEEVHTVLSCGAGGSTRLKQPGSPRIERVFNYKYPAEYIAGIDTLLQRKEAIANFYSNSSENVAKMDNALANAENRH